MSTYIQKLKKESLHGEGQQLQQYQQHQQLPHTSNSWAQKYMTYDVGKLGPDLGQVRNVVALNW